MYNQSDVLWGADDTPYNHCSIDSTVQEVPRHGVKAGTGSRRARQMGRGMAIPSMSQHMSPHVQAMAPGHTPIPPDGPVVANGAWVASGCSPEVTKRKIKVVGPISGLAFFLG